MKNQKGITLVALVVTIVVLLILAGITIAYLLSDTGIFASAKNARRESEAGVIRDYVMQAQGAYMAEYWSTAVTSENGVPTDLTATKIKTLVEGCFPTGAGYSFVGTDSLTGSEGKLSGTFKVTSSRISGYHFAVTFTAGIATVTVTEGAAS